MKSKRLHRDRFLHRMIFRYFPYWPLFAAFILIAVFAAWCYLYITDPVYEIRARLLFEGRNISTSMQQRNRTDSSATMLSERDKLEVLTSRTLIENIVRELNLSSQLYDGGFLHNKPAFASAPIVVQVRNIETVRAKKQVPVSYQAREQLVSFEGKQYRLDSWIRSYYGEIRFVKNERSADNKSGEYYISFEDFRLITDDLIDRLRIERDESSPGIVSIIFRDTDQRRGESILDGLVKTYLDEVNDVRILDRAQSSARPVAPKPLIAYPGAIVFALLLSFGWVTWKEQLSSALLFRSEIEEATSIPIAAEISDSQMKDYVVVDNFRKPQLTDQFMQMRAAIQLYGVHGKSVVMVTSSNAGEGKTFVSANFAISITASDKKVLLLDLDFRNPRLSSLYNIATTAGAADVLLGEASLQETIRPTAVQNLYLLSAGKRRENATTILMDRDLSGLLQKLRSTFDYIVIDTPPVNPVIDGYVISPFCDVTLFVMRHGNTPKTALEPFRLNGKVTTLKNLSIVFNGVRPRGMIKSVYPYGYGNSYEYGEVGTSKRSRWFNWFSFSSRSV
ncbi:MAG TPA: polysaccharide biosynthesis tyrosine autokinase [Chryseolinea sp.]|nr:polysaccharide biosynthesis tyrosine autokinase [Chryseolinea sp.]